jgi:hypothetical protein
MAKNVLCIDGLPRKSAQFAHFLSRLAQGLETRRVRAAGRETICMSAERFTLDTSGQDGIIGHDTLEAAKQVLFEP